MRSLIDDKRGESSIQRFVIILFVIRIVMVIVMFSAFGNQYNILMLLNEDNDLFDNKNNMQDSFLVDNPNLDGTYQQKEIADYQFGLKSTVSGILLQGVVGVFPTEWASDSSEYTILWILNIISLLITALAAFELFQIAWGKKTS